MTVERRFITADLKAELRQGSGGDEMALAGYAAVFNQPSEDLGGFREMIMPGAFARSIREKSDVRALVNHDPNMVLGRVKNSSLELGEDAHGLKFRVILPPTQVGRDTYALVKRGDIDACSFAFIAKEQSWEDGKDESGNPMAMRKLMDVDTMDVSVVLNPAYPQTSVSARSLFPDGEPVEVRAAIERIKKLEKESRAAGDEEESYQDMITEVGNALRETYGASKFGCDKYWQVETFESHVVVCDNDEPNCYYDIPYSESADEKIIFGEMQKMKQEYVPSERALKALKERRGSEAQPPAGPYAIALPQPFDSDMKQEWWDAFMEEYKDAVKRRKLRGQEAIAAAIAHANLAVQPKTEADPQVKGQGADPTNPGPAKTVDTDMGGDDKSKVGATTNPNRSGEGDTEKRIYKSVDQIPNYIPKAKAKQWMEVWNSAYKAAKKDGKSEKDAETLAFKEANGVIKKDKASMDGEGGVSGTMMPDDAGMARAQEVSNPDSPCYDPDDPDYDEELDPSAEDDEENSRASDKKRTKKVDGENLTDDCFAYVGDPDRTVTWKLPIKFSSEEKTKNHIRNAIARFGQTKGIPADKKDAVWKKIVAAAKKYDIDVSEENSARAGVSHDLTRTAIAEAEQMDSVAEQLAERQRLIEIDLDL